jgi:APA family basic amino acid/polyamine antiporter
LFFAFAGYARIATLGEEVRDPSTTIPAAIPRALAGVLVVYAVVGVTLLATVPVAAIAASDAPLELVVAASSFDRLAPIVRIGAGIAAFGVLLNLVPGIARTVLAMARRDELPTFLAHVDGRRAVPLRAEVLVTAVIVALTATLDLRGAIGVSGVLVLTYYAITNAASLRLRPGERRWPRWIAITGLVGCVVLAVMLPLAAVVSAAAILLAGIVVRSFRRSGGLAHPAR